LFNINTKLKGSDEQMEMRKTIIEKISKEEMAESLTSFIFISQQDNLTLTIGEQNQIKECTAKDFYNIIGVDIMDIDEDNDEFMGCEYINEDTIILRYGDRIIKIAK
jgi:hypothetical protein